MEDTVWLKDVDKHDVKDVGVVGATLGELYKIGIPVPNGFIITSQVYFAILKSSGVKDRIKEILFNLDPLNPLSFASCSLLCQKEIRAIKFDKKFEDEINQFFKRLAQPTEKYVIVRSSATDQDSPKTELIANGETSLKETILAAWASLFEPRAIFYRIQKKIDHFKIGTAVVAQKMIRAQISGVLFTVDPKTSDKNTLIIKALFGLEDASGQIDADYYEVSKRNLQIRTRNVKLQNKQLVSSKNTSKLITVAKIYRLAQKLSDEKIVELAALGEKIESHYFFPQVIEWLLGNNRLYIRETKPQMFSNEPNIQEKIAKPNIYKRTTAARRWGSILQRRKYHKTATKLYVNLAQPELVPEISSQNVDGACLLQTQLILTKISPRTQVNKLVSNLLIFCRNFYPRPIMYRSNEPGLFRLELEALKTVRTKYKNIHLVNPFIRTTKELESAKTLVEESGLFKDPDFEFWMVVQTPSNIVLVEDFLKTGANGISIELNDLPMPSSDVEKIIKICSKNNQSCSICLKSTNDQLIEKLVSWGISSISTDPNYIDSTRKMIYEAEHKLIAGKYFNASSDDQLMLAT